jgi:CheY-like chemotaxis protein
MEIIYITQSSSEGLAWCNRPVDIPDVILSDIMMPGMDGYGLVKKIRENKRFQDVKIIAVTSDPLPGEAKHANYSGFDGYLAKPVIFSELLKVMAMVFGDRREEKERKGQLITRHMAEEMSLKGMKILVAEDNAVNHKLITTMLKKLGCEVTGVVNGKEAVETLKKNAFDAVLMDIQMPELNGLEAAKIIRREIDEGIPIIALTAAAMKEDQERTRESGMNDFLAKPININKLKEKLGFWRWPSDL